MTFLLCFNENKKLILKILGMNLCSKSKAIAKYSIAKLTCAVCMLSCSVVSDFFETSWTVTRQALLSVEFSRQEYWSGLPFPSPGDLPGPELYPCFSHLLNWQADSLPLSNLGCPKLD